MHIREWLLDRATKELFPFDKSHFMQDSEEILKDYVEASDPVKEGENRNHCWALLQTWQRDSEYLSSLKFHRTIARHVRRSCRKACSLTSIDAWVNLGPESAELEGLAAEIAEAIRAAWKVQSSWRPHAVQKFSEELSFDRIDKFHIGLENLIGYPPTNSDFLDLMKREHEQGELFADQKGREVDPKIEWNIVMRNDNWNIPGAGCEPTTEIEKREIRQPLEFYFQTAKQIFANAGASHVLLEAEIAALRLWTGPMHKKYAEVLRNSSGAYITTLHAINSGITKLARIWRLPESRKVYRGYRDLSLKDLTKDAFQCVGGVEKCVLATSEDFNIAVHYSGNRAFILEIDVGQVNRGADVSWLSQFPHEREVLFNALSNVEFVRSPQLHFVEGRGTILVYQVCISANVKSKTLEEFVELRKDLHLNLVEILTQEARRVIFTWTLGSKYSLIRNLGEQCWKHCDAVFMESKAAQVDVYNQGTRAYLKLLEAAILLLPQALEICDLALRWFETEIADPNELEPLQDWQLEALRTAFKSSEPPVVNTIVLEDARRRVVSGLFTDSSLSLGTVYAHQTIYNLAKLLSLNSHLTSIKLNYQEEVSLATAEVWERVFSELCPGRTKLCVNNFFLAEYAISTLQELQLKNLVPYMAVMIAPALLLHTPGALTSLNLSGSPIACSGAESLSRAFRSMQCLQYVNLCSCNIADRGCTGISQGLPELTELEDLNLAHNKVGDDGFNILASVIQTHEFSRLKSVDMQFNNTLLPSGPNTIMRNLVMSKHSTDHPVTCVAWRPGGNQIASGCLKIIVIWNAMTGDTISKLEGHTCNVNSIAWSPDGVYIVSGSGGPYIDGRNEIIVWDMKAGIQVSMLKGHCAAVTSVAWSPGCRQIASASNDMTIKIWETVSWTHVSTLKGHSMAVTSVAWSPGGDRIAGGSDDKTVKIWHSESCEQIWTLSGHKSYVKCLAWSPWGDRIASGSSDRTIIIWNPESGCRVLRLYGHSLSVRSVTWNPGGELFASASDDATIIIWNAKTRNQDSKSETRNKVVELKGNTRAVKSVAWSPEGDRIASGSLDAMIIWDVKFSSQVWAHNLKGKRRFFNCVAWSPVGDQIVSCGQGSGFHGSGELVIWDAKTGEAIAELEGHRHDVTCVAWSPGGNQIVSGSCADSDRPGEVIIWDVKTGDQIALLRGQTHGVRSVSWNSGGDRLASASDTTIFIWDVKTGKQVLTLNSIIKVVTCLVWRPGSDQVAAGCKDQSLDDDKIIIWDAKTGDVVSTLKGHAGPVTCLAWHPLGDKIATGSKHGTIIVWDAKAMVDHKRWALNGHPEGVEYVSWCRWGSRIASASSDRTIIIWDVKTSYQIALLQGHIASVKCVAWHPLIDQIVSGGYCGSGKKKCQGEIFLWDLRCGDKFSTLKGQIPQFESVACSPEAEKVPLSSYNEACTSKTGGTISTGPTSDVSNLTLSPIKTTNRGDENIEVQEMALKRPCHSLHRLGDAWNPYGDSAVDPRDSMSSQKSISLDECASASNVGCIDDCAAVFSDGCAIVQGEYQRGAQCEGWGVSSSSEISISAAPCLLSLDPDDEGVMCQLPLKKKKTQ